MKHSNSSDISIEARLEGEAGSVEAPQSRGLPPLSTEAEPAQREQFVSLREKTWGFLGRPEVRVWRAPLLKAGTLILALSCVAMLGHAADRKDRAGVRLSSISPEGKSVAPVPSAAPEEDRAVETEVSSAGAAVEPCVPQEKAQGLPGVTEDGRVILNEASVEDFMRLPGVGKRRAESLVALREKLGKFKKAADLMRVRGIGWKSLKKFEGLIVVDRPPVSRSGEPAP